MEQERKEQKAPWYKRAGQKMKEAAIKTVETGILVFQVIKENKEVLAACITTACTVGSLAYKGHERQEERAERKHDAKTEIEDEVTGYTIFLSRPLTRDEQVEFNKRAKKARKTGDETYFDILWDIDPDLIDE